MFHFGLEIALALLTLCGLAFYTIALWSADAFTRERSNLSDEFSPPLSILKPVKGADEATYEALRSHCLQEYPSAYEIVFGVNDERDAALPIIQKLISEFPRLKMRVHVCTEVLGTNRKVSNLIHLFRAAEHEYILVNDGDIKVSPGYLREVMTSFGDPEVGMVTCLYRGKPAATLASRLEGLGIAADFAPGVLTARNLEGGLRFALGSTMAMRRSALEKIEGFDSVVDYLADDYQLGERIAAAGFKIALAHEIVETSIPPYSFSQFWEHQLRWARTMRISRPGGYRGLIFTFALPWAILLAVVAPNHAWVWILLAITLLARIAVALKIGREILQDKSVVSSLWLLPLRDVIALALWLASYFGDEISWRGERFRVQNGKLIPSTSGSAATPSVLEDSGVPQRR